MSRRASAGRIFAVPLAIGVMTAAGLAAGLIGEGGGWDITANTLLALPLGITAWCWKRPRPEKLREQGACVPFGRWL